MSFRTGFALPPTASVEGVSEPRWRHRGGRATGHGDIDGQGSGGGTRRGDGDIEVETPWWHRSHGSGRLAPQGAAGVPHIGSTEVGGRGVGRRSQLVARSSLARAVSAGRSRRWQSACVLLSSATSGRSTSSQSSFASSRKGVESSASLDGNIGRSVRERYSFL